MNIAHWLARSAAAFPHRPAIAVGQDIWADYARFATRAARIAFWLREQGVEPGDRVTLFMSNRPEYLELVWGVWWSGAVVVPVNVKLHPREVAWIAQHSHSKVIFCEESYSNSTQHALSEINFSCPVVYEFGFANRDGLESLTIVDRHEDDAAWLFYTSGTTGRPKGVLLGHRQLRLMSLAYLSSVQPVHPQSVMLHPAPLSHGGGMYHLPYVMQAGLNVVPNSQGFDAFECIELIEFWKSVSFFAAPTMVQRLVGAVKQRTKSLVGLDTIVYGGGPMYLADIKEALEVIGPHFVQIYGQGECPMTISVLSKHVINDDQNPNFDRRLGSVGLVSPMVEVTIQTPEGDLLPIGETGEVCVRGDVVMLGYWKDQAATDATIRHGWLLTGDVGRMDDEGFLTLLDRSKDLVVSGGTNIYPREVEEALLTHSRVHEVSVIGRPDPEWGEVVVAYVVCREPVSVNDLDAHCLDRIARFKRPKHYCFVSELPKNHYGKVLKTTLRQLDQLKMKEAVI